MVSPIRDGKREVPDIRDGKEEVQKNQSVETRKRPRELEKIQSLANRIQPDANDLGSQEPLQKKITTLPASHTETFSNLIQIANSSGIQPASTSQFESQGHLNLKKCGENVWKAVRNYKKLESLTIEEPEFDSSSLKYLAEVNGLKRLSIELPMAWFIGDYEKITECIATIPLLEELEIKCPLRVYWFETLVYSWITHNKTNQIQTLSLTLKIYDLKFFLTALDLISNFENLKGLKLELVTDEGYMSAQELEETTFLKNLKLDKLTSLKNLEKFELVNSMVDSMVHRPEDLIFLKQFTHLKTFQVAGKEVFTPNLSNDSQNV